MTATVAPVLRYPGGKARIAPWIVDHLPPHEVYCEPFFGGGSGCHGIDQCFQAWPEFRLQVGKVDLAALSLNMASPAKRQTCPIRRDGNLSVRNHMMDIEHPSTDVLAAAELASSLSPLANDRFDGVPTHATMIAGEGASAPVVIRWPVDAATLLHPTGDRSSLSGVSNAKPLFGFRTRLRSCARGLALMSIGHPLSVLGIAPSFRQSLANLLAGLVAHRFSGVGAAKRLPSLLTQLSPASRFRDLLPMFLRERLAELGLAHFFLHFRSCE